MYRFRRAVGNWRPAFFDMEESLPAALPLPRPPFPLPDIVCDWLLGYRFATTTTACWSELGRVAGVGGSPNCSNPSVAISLRKRAFPSGLF